MGKESVDGGGKTREGVCWKIVIPREQRIGGGEGLRGVRDVHVRLPL